MSKRMMLVAAMSAMFLCACGSVRLPLLSDAEHARNDFTKGVKAYESGDYAEAAELLRDSLKDGLADKKDQLIAHKYLAFINCFSSHEKECRSEFRKALEIDPDFELEPEESGHPIWAPVFLEVRKEFSGSDPGSQH